MQCKNLIGNERKITHIKAANFLLNGVNLRAVFRFALLVINVIVDGFDHPHHASEIIVIGVMFVREIQQRL